MAIRKASPGLKGQTQKERAAAGLVSTIVVTSMGTCVGAEDVLPSILTSIGKREVDEERINSQKTYIGSRVSTKKGTFMLLANAPDAPHAMKARMQGADINIVLVDKEINNDVSNLIGQTKQDNLIFLSCLRAASADIKKSIKKTFGKTKVYTLNEIGRVLESKTVLNRKRHTRPHFLPDTLEQLGERLFKITGAVDKGFVSGRILINGSIIAQIREILVDGKPLDISGLAPLTKEDIYQKKKEEGDAMADIISHLRISENNINDQPEYSDDSLGCVNLEETEEEKDSEDESEDYADLEEVEYEESSCEVNSDDLVGYGALGSENKKKELIQKYKGFKGFKTINLGLHKKASDRENETIKVFRTQNLPEYYTQLSFIGSERARRKILAKKSPVPVRTPFELTFEVDPASMEAFGACMLSGQLSVHGLFDYEGSPTICTLGFSAKETISMYNRNLFFDFGFFHSMPGTLVFGNGTEVVKCKTEGTTGTICFIGPLVLTDDKIAISLDGRTVGSALHAIRKDPIIIKTVVFRGVPVKIQKRSCVIGKMFRTREEVKYFKDIKLYSSLKKEGHIKKPLGEKGLMKCYFFPPIKHGEKVYMELARRVFITPDE
ncbi:pre-rRNA-processing protein TSR1 [Nematocida major]|uniref:pre-rRNA-processing protein TSR1 n=1 Tax=Nematocida major TaxID=1912982 RepID=UPI0020089881|nr:pre-rRNA-processing protein TSR1 [Nematocida major]KAH9387070.1 pre-rRNA-processing protein TSR1 [Nematocida major]